MKKALIILILTAFLLVGCEASNENSLPSETDGSAVTDTEHSKQEEVSKEAESEAADNISLPPEVSEVQEVITVTQTYPEERIFTLSAEDTDFVKDLWEGEWLADITRTVCDFEFVLDGNIIKYSNEAGLFNDYENQRHMILTEEQKDAVNKMLGIE